ncbi:MAG: hypothetical protein R2828_29355 [Saprospiraceae bacterium]
MRKVWLFTFGLFFSFSLQAQFGVKGAYHFSDAADWQAFSTENGAAESIIGNGWSVGVDYWFRLKKHRVEFLPELNYSLLQQDFPNLGWSNDASFTSFFFNTNLYIFDLKGDCDCPTFSKQGPTLKKGVFIQLSPGISYAASELTLPSTTLKANTVAFSIGAGIGFDLGLSDLLTLSPMLGLRYYPGIQWDTFAATKAETDNFPVLDNTSSLNQWYAGLRLGIRLDQ